MAFGEQDTVRLCRQFRDAAAPHPTDGQYAALSSRLERVEHAVRFIAAVQSIDGLTDEEIARLTEIAGRSMTAPSRSLSRRAHLSAASQPDRAGHA